MLAEPPYSAATCAPLLARSGGAGSVGEGRPQRGAWAAPPVAPPVWPVLQARGVRRVLPQMLQVVRAHDVVRGDSHRPQGALLGLPSGSSYPSGWVRSGAGEDAPLCSRPGAREGPAHPALQDTGLWSAAADGHPRSPHASSRAPTSNDRRPGALNNTHVPSAQGPGPGAGPGRAPPCGPRARPCLPLPAKAWAARGVPGLVASSLQLLPPSSRGFSPLRLPFSASLLRGHGSLGSGPPDNPAGSHLETLTAVISAKTHFPSELTRAGSRALNVVTHFGVPSRPYKKQVDAPRAETPL